MKYTFLLFIILVSCTNDTNFSRIYSIHKSQENNLDLYFAGFEKKYFLQELLSSYNYNSNLYGNSNRKNKLIELNKISDNFSEISDKALSDLNQLKIKLIQYHNQPVKLDDKFKKEYKINAKFKSPVIYNLTNFSANQNSDFLFQNKFKIKLLIENYRKNLIYQFSKSLFYSNNQHDKRPFIKYMNIKSYKNEQDFDKQFNKLISISSIPTDDAEFIKRTYKIISKSEDIWEQLLTDNSNFLNEFEVLLNLENEILIVRKEFFSLIHMYLARCSEYPITDYEPIIYGPNVGKKGDTLELTNRVVFYDAESKPVIRVNNYGKVISNKSGTGKIQVVIPSNKDFTVQGTISILKKNGEYHDFPWEYKIKVIN